MLHRGRTHGHGAALGLSLCMMLSATLLPILACGSQVAAGPQKWSSWKLGAFALAAERVGGVPLGMWTCLAAMASSAGLLNAFMCTSARSVQAMACKGLLPATLRKEMGLEATPGAALLFTSTSDRLVKAVAFWGTPAVASSEAA